METNLKVLIAKKNISIGELSKKIFQVSHCIS